MAGDFFALVSRVLTMTICGLELHVTTAILPRPTLLP